MKLLNLRWPPPRPVLDDDARQLLNDTLEAFEPGEGRLTLWTLLDRITAARPDAYNGWTSWTLRDALRPYGIGPVEQDGRDAEGNLRVEIGVSRAAVATVIQRAR
ncbi:hypothetical protein [Streptosporangium roseum]|uniref:hypothetical protein n=1 Tax=Streptosporangium roseum TaxID=2001 RepID=UPI0004CC94A7|nr:hypothetical protein [Streptosporangium roseum]